MIRVVDPSREDMPPATISRRSGLMGEPGGGARRAQMNDRGFYEGRTVWT